MAINLPERRAETSCKPTRDHFLAGAAFAGDEDADLGGADALDHALDLGHLRRAVDHARQAEIGGLAQSAVFFLQRMHAAGALDNELEHIDVDGLLDEIESALPHCLHRVGAIGISADHDHLGARGGGQNPFERLQTFARAILIGRQAQIEQADAEAAVGFELAQRIGARARDGRGVRGKRPFHLALQAGIVLHQEDRFALCRAFADGCFAHAEIRRGCWAALGSSSVIVVPLPTLLDTSMSPPRSRIVSFA